MARRKIEKNIAYDDVRKLYYVTLVWGMQEDGNYKKTAKTTRNKKEAKQILKKCGVELFAVQNHFSLLSMERQKEVLQYCKNRNLMRIISVHWKLVSIWHIWYMIMEDLLVQVV